MCAARREEPEKPTEAVAMSTASADDELSLEAVIEERRLEAQNEADDARYLLLGTTSAGAIDLDGAGAQTGTGSTSPTADASNFANSRFIAGSFLPAHLTPCAQGPCTRAKLKTTQWHTFHTRHF